MCQKEDNDSIDVNENDEEEAEEVKEDPIEK